MAKLLTKAFFNRHPLQEFSAARMEYSLLLSPDVAKTANKLMRDKGLMPASETAVLKEIEAANDLTVLLRFARRELPGDGKLLIRDKLLACEEQSLPEIQRMLLTTGNDIFAENALHLFLDFKADPVPWLLKHFNQIRYPYARSLMCLVLGFRGNAQVVPFLMQQLKLFTARFPQDNLDQAPLLALYELHARFETA